MKKFAFLITALFVMVGLVGISPASASTSVTLEASSYSEASHSVSVNSVVRARADGKVQLSYFNPNAKRWTLAQAKKCKQVYVSINWSKAKIQRVVKANKRKINGTWCLRLKHGSTWANSGKNGNLDVPFTATVRGNWSLMTLKYPKKGIWGHKGEYRGGKFWQVCDNEWKIGVKPTLKDTQVVMVRSEAEVEYRINYSVITQGSVSVTGKLACPAGDLYGSASAAASGRTDVSIYVKARSVAEAKIKGQASGEANTSALAAARVQAKTTHEMEALAKVTLTCSDAPPAYETPSVDVSPVACVEPGQTRDVTVTVSNPNGSADTARVTYRGQTSEKAIAAHGQATFTFANQAAGTYSGTALLVNANKSKSFTVTVEECEVPPPYTCPPGTSWTDIDHDGVREEGECFGAPTFTQFREFNDLYKSLPGQPTTMDHFVTVDTPAGHSYTVTWTAVWGSFAAPTKTGQDGVQVSSTYTAPSEVPPAHPGEGLSAGYDKITVTVVDNVTGQRIVRSTAPFKIKEWPATP